MTAEKDNKIYTIDQNQVAAYQTAGFDIRDDDGKLIEYGVDKTVPYSDYAKVLKENEELKKQLSSLRTEAKDEKIEEELVEEAPVKPAKKKAGQ